MSSPAWVTKSFWRWVFYFFCAACLAVGLKHFFSGFHDYEIYHTAGLKILNGAGDAVYDRTRVEPGGFYYPYFWALVFAAFLKITWGFDKVVFLLVFVFSFLKLVVFSTRRVIEWQGIDRSTFFFIATVVTFLGFYSFNDALMNSNIGLLLALFSVLSFEAYEKKKWVLASAILAFGISLKFYPLLLVGYWAWRREWKIVIATCLFVGFYLVGVPILFEGIENGVQRLADSLFVVSNYGAQSGWDYNGLMFQNFTGSMLRLLGPLGFGTDEFLLPIFFTGVLGVLALYLPSFIEGLKGNDHPKREWVFFHAFGLIAVLAPVSWYNMGVFYIPLFAYIVSRSFVLCKKVDRFCLGFLILFYCFSAEGIVSKSFNDILEGLSVPFWGLMFVFVPFSYRLFLQKNKVSHVG